MPTSVKLHSSDPGQDGFFRKTVSFSINNLNTPVQIEIISDMKGSVMIPKKNN